MPEGSGKTRVVAVLEDAVAIQCEIDGLYEEDLRAIGACIAADAADDVDYLAAHGLATTLLHKAIAEQDHAYESLAQRLLVKLGTGLQKDLGDQTKEEIRAKFLARQARQQELGARLRALLGELGKGK